MRFIAARSPLILLVVGATLALTGVGIADSPAPPGPFDRTPRMDWNELDYRSGKFHNVGQMLLHVSNLGYFGNWPNSYFEDDTPSCEWPRGSGINFLFAAGLWVGGLVGGDTLVTAGVYQHEFLPVGDRGIKVKESTLGVMGGNRFVDDDGDFAIDEDPLDGWDDDEDGRVDEDFSAISEQMFACVYYDTATYMNEYLSDREEWHSPLNLKVRQESYSWSSTRYDDFVGVEYHVTNIGDDPIEMVYIGFMVDPDVGPDHIDGYYTDDMTSYVELDTTVTAGTSTKDIHVSVTYAWDDSSGNDGAATTGYMGVMFLGHTTDPTGAIAPNRVSIHAYKNWLQGDQDPHRGGMMRAGIAT